MIEVNQLTKHYGAHLAVDRISFTAGAGEVIGLLGPNGAGKTTTMRMLTGFMPPTSGTATIAGFDILEDSLEVRQHVGYLPERVPVYPDMTVRGYVTFWAQLRGLRRPRKQVDAVLERVHLSDRRNSLVRNLSKGMRQRLGLAQALVHNPPVLILDEPTIGIDPQQVIEVRQQVRELGRDHTVLFSTHILSEAEQVCDRVVIINNGHVLAEGKPADLRDQLEPGASLYIEIAGVEPANAAALLTGIDGVTSVTAQGDGYVVRAQPGHDIRPAVFAAVSAAGGSLLELRPVALTLEDIFLELVSREAGVA